MSDDLCLIAVACATLVKKKCQKNRKIRSKWCRKWLMNRGNFSHVHLLEELRLEPEDWRNYLRMDENVYLELLDLVTPLIKRQDTNMRSAISAHERLTATLRFLATGRNYKDLKFSTIISAQALGQIIPERCNAICDVLQGKFMKFPTTESEWTHIAQQFENICNFPNCLGAVDGKHIKIIPPPGSGAYYYNYKGFHSLVLMAICNANYEFILCDIGVNGRISDGGAIEYTRFYQKLKEGTLHLPNATCPENSQRQLPFVFIGDEAFALRTDFLKAYSQKDLDHSRKIFNYRLSRARCKIENTFGILAVRFRIFHTAIGISIDSIENVVMACCVLHNFLRNKCTSTYTPNDSLDKENFEDGRVQLGLRADVNQLVHLQSSHHRRAYRQAVLMKKELYLGKTK